MLLCVSRRARGARTFCVFGPSGVLRWYSDRSSDPGRPAGRPAFALRHHGMRRTCRTAVSVALPDGSVQHIRYTGDVEPQLIFLPARAEITPIAIFEDVDAQFAALS